MDDIQIGDLEDQDQWSDAHDTLDDQSLIGHPTGIERVHTQQDMAVHNVKISTDDDKTDPSPILDSSRGESMSTAGGIAPDTASIHSLPAVHITESDPPTRRPSTANAPESNIPTAARARQPSPLPSEAEASLTPHERRHRHRSAAEARSSNRLSGFFTSLIHRREVGMSVAARGSIREDSPSGPSPASASHPPSRTSSPPPRAVTPPPQLPPPTLQELGLSLSVLTSDLSPSHFSTPPSSGAFLAPHFLLLCHAQGLDVLPLVSPPAPQPYALIRRVSFKSVVVMEQRGVLVAIAGRRDGVRVYALEEVKKAIEWRIDAEVRRERERARRELAKKVVPHSIDGIGADHRSSSDIVTKNSISTVYSGAGNKQDRKSSYNNPPASPPLIPRNPTVRTQKKQSAQAQAPQIPEPSGRPPPYTPPDTAPRLRNQSSIVSFGQAHSRRGSVNNVLASYPSRRDTEGGSRSRDRDSKAEWVESSDEEAIDIVAAGSSGSQALDERTSARATSGASAAVEPPVLLRSTTAYSPRRARPANLDLSLTRANTSSVIPSEPSPAPTLLTLRQALSHAPTASLDSAVSDPVQDPETPVGDGDDDDEVDGQISLAQALFESRIPDLPPAGSRRPQRPILITSSHAVAAGDDDAPSSPRTSEHNSMLSRRSDRTADRRRRRWSVLGTIFPNGSPMQPSSPTVPESTNETISDTTAPSNLTRSQSFRSAQSHSTTVSPRPASAGNTNLPHSSSNVPPLPEPSLASTSVHSRSRFIPRIISNAFGHRRTEDQSQSLVLKTADNDIKRLPGTPTMPHAPPPKLEYVKLPGTKGAIAVKAVETAKKSFLAILCGENGEKVELFAGTYRTALGLSRTFILPDSPRSLELQLQGDDLVEVFLVFSQNVFGLEPATVRVREVRIGRAERRAARRRAREIRTGEAATNDVDGPSAGDEDTNVNVSIGVSVAVGSQVVASGEGADDPSSPALIPANHPDQPDGSQTPNDPASASAAAHAEELVALATAQMGPYTTFQQLSFAPKFPLASISDDYIIPPTYPSFLEYRTAYEPEADGSNNTDLTRIQFSPPGLPVPTPSAPSKWFYRDPKNIVHGPWKASLMQLWYKDGLLPPDLPVRREEETEFTLLKDLRLQSVDPTQPFRAPLPSSNSMSMSIIEDSAKPLLPPISLLSQPRHFGPPALFFSSRGGHSTAIVDARGRSVLKGRFLWSPDDQDDEARSNLYGRMGDVKRLEAFDVKNRAVLVAMRQGGLEAMDLGDALLKPADESRTVLPHFSSPPSNTNRRGPFVWKIGTPVASSSSASTVLSGRSKGSFIPGKKQSTGSTKSPANKTEFSVAGDGDDGRDEVLFLGRKDDEIYICERNAGSFRILRLCPELPR